MAPGEKSELVAVEEADTRSVIGLTIAVPTYLRPHVMPRLLPMLVEQMDRLDARYRSTILVIDNDPQGGARAAVGPFIGEHVRYVHEEVPGISAVRNRALDEADDLVVFIDDDELPGEEWLVPLVRTWEKFGAALVSGRVVVEFAVPPEPWLVGGGFFDRRSLLTGSPIVVASTNNVLVDVCQARDLDVRFSLELGLSGGEDTLFSSQLHSRGGRMVWCEQSSVIDLVPAGRLTRRWALTRAWSHGNSTAIVAMRLGRERPRRLSSRLVLVAGGGGRVILGVLMGLVGAVLRQHARSARGWRTAARGGGIVSGALGSTYEEYKRT